MNINVLQHNINNWNNKRFQLYNTYRHINPDIILLNDIGQAAKVNLQGYYTYQKNKDNLVHGGVAISIKKQITHKIIDDFDSDMLGIEVSTILGPVIISTAYRPPAAPYLDVIDLNKIINTDTPSYFFGDLNANHPTLGYRTTNNAGTMINKLIQRNKITHLGPHFPTFINARCSSTPDIAFANKKAFHNYNITPGPQTSSDHTPIIIKISTNPIAIPIHTRFQYSRADWEGYQEQIQNNIPNISQQATKSEIDNTLKRLNRVITDAADNNIPKIKHRIIPGAKTTREIRLLFIQLTNTYNHIRMYGHSSQHAQILISLRREIATAYEIQQRLTWNELIQKMDLESDPKKFWSDFRRFKGTNHKRMKHLTDDQNNKLTTNAEKHTYIHKHFSENIFEDNYDEPQFNELFKRNTDSYLQLRNEDILPYDNADLTRLNQDFPPVTEDEVKHLILHTKQKAAGESGITAKHLKNLPTAAISSLTNIFNLTLSCGYFPKIFKKAIFILIPKPLKSQYRITNYRPISLLETHGKTLGRFLNHRLNHYMWLKDTYNTRQHGFRKDRGTHTALAYFYETISSKNYDKQHINTVLRDVSKAFDKVWHTGLKYKILKLNLHPCFTKILCGFLDDRTAAVRLGHSLGPPFNLFSGVPQGAVLSPTLYNLYTADTPNPTLNSEYVSYADDVSQIIFSMGAVLPKHTRKAIQTVNHFENKHRIKTNTNKFKIIPIGQRNRKPPISINGQNITYSNSGKILGLKYGRCSLVGHVTERINIARQALNKLYRFNNLSTKNKTKLYITTVRSVLMYPPVPLNTLSNTQMRRLQRVQNSATRFIANVRPTDRISSQSIHRRLNLEPINIVIHKQAQKIWENMKLTLPNMYNRISYTNPPIRTTQRFPSSRRIAEETNFIPIYS